jgi:signal transduction histidine kinase
MPGVTRAAEGGSNAEAELRRLRAREQEKDELCSALLHDLRNPLSITLTWTHLLSEGMLDAPGIERAIETLRRNAELQARMLTSFAGYVQLTGDEPALATGRHDLRRLVEAAVDVVRGAAEGKPVTLELALGEGPSDVSGDESWLGAALRALFEHALETTPPRGRMRIAVRLAADGAVVEVERTGDPFSKQDLEHLFDPVGPPDRLRGHGNLKLELATARRVAELHGGELVAESLGSDGARYRLRLPLAS